MMPQESLEKHHLCCQWACDSGVVADTETQEVFYNYNVYKSMRLIVACKSRYIHTIYET